MDTLLLGSGIRRLPRLCIERCMDDRLNGQSLTLALSQRPKVTMALIRCRAW